MRLGEIHREDLTHETGRYVLAAIPAGRYTITLRRIGYTPVTRTVEVVAGDTAHVDVALATTVVQLAATVVTGTVSERTRDEVLSPTSAVTGRELERRLQQTIGETLRDQPGVSVTSTGPATARPVIRGLSGDRILVLEDGQRPGDLSSTSGDHAVAVEPVTAQQMEVVRGPMSLLYGSSALGGVVNVIREEVPATLARDAHGSFTTQGQSVNRGGVIGGEATTGIGAWTLRGEASARGAGDTRTPRGVLPNTEAATFNGSVGASWFRDRGHVGAAYRAYVNSYGIPADPNDTDGAHAGGVDIRMRRHTLRATGEVHPHRGVGHVIGNATFTSYGHEEIEGTGAIGTEFDQLTAAGDVLARHDKLGPFTSGAIGARAQWRDLTTGGSLRTPSTRDYNAAAYMVQEAVRGHWRIQLGGRYDVAHYAPREQTVINVGGRQVPVRARTFAALSGSAGLLYEVATGLRVGTSVARAYRTPDINELYSDGPHLAANSYDVGDPDLDEETGIGVDAFVRFSRWGVNAEVAGFRNALYGFIHPSSRGRVEQGPQAGRPRLQYTNTDALFTGYEGSLEWNVTSRLVADATLSRVDARFTEPREPIAIVNGADTTWVEASRYPPFVPPMHGRAGLRYERSAWSLGGEVRAAARQDRTGDFEMATPGYTLGNLWASVRMVTQRRVHTITLRLNNVTNVEYREHLSRTKEFMPEPGRDVSLVYRLGF